jgi:SAM-dependent methyltransferase
MVEALFDSVARFYDKEIEGLAAISNDVSFYAEYARMADGEVLDLACGTGRTLIPLAEKGITITGLDISENMLEQARRKINLLPVDVQERIQLERQDMTTFTMGKTFSLIFCTFRSFQHLISKKEQSACLGRVHEHLNDRGIFILHLFVPLHHLLAQKQRSLYLGTFQDPDTGCMVTRHSEVLYDLAAQVLHEDRFYEWTDKGGQFHRQVWSFDFAYLFRYEAELLLEKCGFSIINVYGGFNKAPFDYYSGEQIFVVKKMPS